MRSWRMSRRPGSGYGSDIAFHSDPILPRIAVTVLKAGCDVSTSFFPADRNAPSAPNVSAASDFCSRVNVFRVPNHWMLTRTAAMVVRKRSAGEEDTWAAGVSKRVLMANTSIGL